MNYELFVGIDQSKLTVDVAVLEPRQSKEVHHHKFENNRKGFKAMMRMLSRFGYSLEQILFCSENTGVYSLPLSVFLEEQKASFWLENPLQIKLSSGLKRGKNDKADAKDIARYCFTHQHEARLFKMPAKTIMALRQLLAFRERLIKNKMALKIPSHELRGLGAEADALIFKESSALVNILDEKIEVVNHQMLRLINEDESLKKQFGLVTSVYGVGKQTALFILIYTNAFSSFDDWRKFACYCGIAPFEYSSGTSIRGKTRISKMGNKKLKSLLTMCALNTLKKENEFKAYYDRRIQEGKSPMSTINIIRNKIVSRIFAAIKRGTPYQPVLSNAA